MNRIRRADLLPGVSDHLCALWVHGAQNMDVRDLSDMGADIYGDPYVLEDVVFDLIEQRRTEVGQPYVTVTLGDVKKIGWEVKAGIFDLDELRNNQLSAAHNHLGRLGVRNVDLESLTLSTARHENPKAIIKAESRILSDKDGLDDFMNRFLGRIAKQVEEDGEIRLLELIDRTINLTNNKLERHGRKEVKKFRPAEHAVHCLEEERIARMKSVANRILRPNLEVVLDSTNGG